MSNKQRQLVDTWLRMLESIELQVQPWDRKILRDGRATLTMAEHTQDPQFVIEYLHQIAPVAKAGRWWYRLMFPIRLLGRLLYTCVLVVLSPFTLTFYVRLIEQMSDFWDLMVKLFGILTAIAFVGLFVFHRRLYDQGHDLGWTYGEGVLYAGVVALLLECFLVFVIGEVLILVRYWSQSTHRML